MQWWLQACVFPQSSLGGSMSEIICKCKTYKCVCACNWAAVCAVRRIRNIRGERCSLWSWQEAYCHIRALFSVWVVSSYFSFQWIWGGHWDGVSLVKWSRQMILGSSGSKMCSASLTSARLCSCWWAHHPQQSPGTFTFHNPCSFPWLPVRPFHLCNSFYGIYHFLQQERLSPSLTVSRVFPVFQHALHFSLIRLFVLLYCRDKEWHLDAREHVLSVCRKIRENALSWKWNSLEFKTHFCRQLFCIFIPLAAISTGQALYLRVNAPMALNSLCCRYWWGNE